MEYGLIGEKLAHSFSKEIHEQIENYKYELCEVARDDLDAFMKAKDFKAINVTIPYKEAVIPYLYSIDSKAEAIGAVNTVVNREGKLYGYNTDFIGMEALIRKLGIDLLGKKVLVLGTGGTSKTARAVASYLGASIVVTVSRSESESTVTYDEMYASHTDAPIIINTTPCGMYPDCDASAVDIDRFPNLEGVIDAIYNPLRTNLISDALKKGIKAEGGLYMLVSQAISAAEHFTGKTYDSDILDKIYSKIYFSKQNIVLIGMPSSGKTTVGKELARLTGREFVDTDALIVSKHKMSILDIFAACGEKTFREWESECVAQASQKSGCIIATGGGAVLKDENVYALRRNGRLYFLDRPLESLMPTSDRPLASDVQSIQKRYNERYPLYTSIADEIIKIDSDPTQIAQRILSAHTGGEQR